ncbi:hypothetical protein ABIA73_003100 [Stenotrophomonas sp. 2694]
MDIRVVVIQQQGLAQAGRHESKVFGRTFPFDVASLCEPTRRLLFLSQK